MKNKILKAKISLLIIKNKILLVKIKNYLNSFIIIIV